MKPSLDSRSVFLSASFPVGTRGKAFPDSDPAAVSDAVTAVVRAIFAANGLLVLGGHPTITPLVLHVAGDRNCRGSVDIYQSRWFDDELPTETLRLEELGFGRIHRVSAAGSLDDSLREMRVQMLSDTGPVGGVFIGGMEGIRDEWRLFADLAHGRPRIPLVAPGGAAAQLIGESGLPSTLMEELSSPHYPSLSRAIVDYLANL